ncbi:hypothetical protein T4B_5095 [Trichinella pseudospiralis]|uniref:Uncharacterized protein n=2 Tax=Trichinella pseudospiralis TaxID=6337 RepID=A0A0V1IPR0_TRIPS|nr:hypothetical protein T4D_13291 [Trichinella pseudospiralis]KRZ24598.1 hypothetical protein T4B_5095 [Trichinella pseudospiralis]
MNCFQFNLTKLQNLLSIHHLHHQYNSDTSNKLSYRNMTTFIFNPLYKMPAAEFTHDSSVQFERAMDV